MQEAYLAGVIKDLSVYSSRAPAGISLRYPFGEPYTGLRKQRVR
jgi:hypothetical protein